MPPKSNMQVVQISAIALGRQAGHAANQILEAMQNICHQYRQAATALAKKRLLVDFRLGLLDHISQDRANQYMTTINQVCLHGFQLLNPYPNANRNDNLALHGAANGGVAPEYTEASFIIVPEEQVIISEAAGGAASSHDRGISAGQSRPTPTPSPVESLSDSSSSASPPETVSDFSSSALESSAPSSDVDSDSSEEAPRRTSSRGKDSNKRPASVAGQSPAGGTGRTSKKTSKNKASKKKRKAGPLLILPPAAAEAAKPPLYKSPSEAAAASIPGWAPSRHKSGLDGRNYVVTLDYIRMFLNQNRNTPWNNGNNLAVRKRARSSLRPYPTHQQVILLRNVAKAHDEWLNFGGRQSCVSVLDTVNKTVLGKLCLFSLVYFSNIILRFLGNLRPGGRALEHSK